MKYEMHDENNFMMLVHLLLHPRETDNDVSSIIKLTAILLQISSILGLKEGSLSDQKLRIKPPNDRPSL